MELDDIKQYNGKNLFMIKTMYNRRVWFAFDSIPELKEIFGVEELSEDSAAETQTVEHSGTLKKGELIRFENNDVATPENIAHEAIHAALDILEDSTAGDVVLSNDYRVGTESLCYLVQMIVKEIWQCQQFNETGLRRGGLVEARNDDK